MSNWSRGTQAGRDPGLLDPGKGLGVSVRPGGTGGRVRADLFSSAGRVWQGSPNSDIKGSNDRSACCVRTTAQALSSETLHPQRRHRDCDYTLLAQEHIEAQRGEVTCPVSPSPRTAERGSVVSRRVSWLQADGRRGRQRCGADRWPVVFLLMWKLPTTASDRHPKPPGTHHSALPAPTRPATPVWPLSRPANTYWC